MLVGHMKEALSAYMGRKMKRRRQKATRFLKSQSFTYLIPPSTAVMATRCLGGRFTRIRMTLDVKYVPISMDRSSDSTCAGIENLWRRGREYRKDGRKGEESKGKSRGEREGKENKGSKGAGGRCPWFSRVRFSLGEGRCPSNRSTDVEELEEK